MFAARRLHLGDIILEEEPVLVGKGRAESMEWAGAMEQEFRKLDGFIQVSCWQCCGSEIIFFGSGSGFGLNFGSGSGLLDKSYKTI